MTDHERGRVVSGRQDLRRPVVDPDIEKVGTTGVVVERCAFAADVGKPDGTSCRRHGEHRGLVGIARESPDVVDEESTGIAGANFKESTAEQHFPLSTKTLDNKGVFWEYVRAAGAVAANATIGVTTGGATTSGTTHTAVVAIPINYYSWIKVIP